MRGVGRERGGRGVEVDGEGGGVPEGRGAVVSGEYGQRVSVRCVQE